MEVDRLGAFIQRAQTVFYFKGYFTIWALSGNFYVLRRKKDGI